MTTATELHPSVGPSGVSAHGTGGATGWLKRLAARRLAIFPVPGCEPLVHAGLDPKQPGVSLVATPRAANVLLAMTPLAEPLRRAAAIAYAQMPRPRLFVTLGELSASDELPPADAVLSRAEMDHLRKRLTPLLAASGEAKAEPFGPPFLKELTGDENDEDEDEEDSGGDHDHHDHGGDDHEHHEHGGGGHEHHDHGGGGFMSMVAMTKDMPRGSDGLQMEPVEAHFGPFHPGLPAGVAVKLTLGGDSVRKAGWSGSRPVSDLASLGGPTVSFADAYDRLYPFLPHTRRALAETHTHAWSTDDWRHAIPTLERERAASHLCWVGSFARLLGFARLREAAMDLLVEIATGSASADRARRLVDLAEKAPYVRRRLRGLGHLKPTVLQTLSGPVVRAAGLAGDARQTIEAYQIYEYAPVITEGNDALARLEVRLQEIVQSLDLVAQAESATGTAAGLAAPPESSAKTALPLETPQGVAFLKREEGGGLRLHSPLPALIDVIPAVAEGAELSDALVAIASLDPSPWLHPLEMPEEEDNGGSEVEHAHHHHHHHHGGHDH